MKAETEANKLNRISAAISLLDRLNKESFLDRLVIGNEESIQRNNVQRKRIWKLADERAESIV